MRILVLGGKGRLGAALARKWAARHDVRAVARPELDVADLAALKQLLAGERFDVLVNATGLTNVDRCESAREEAKTVNALAPGLMGDAAASAGAPLIHFSTDYVFDGLKSTPYTEEDEARPLGWYGRTKLDGENAVLAVSPRHLVVRVSWVFGPDKPSFVDMIVDRARQSDRVEAIADKVSCPTFADDVAAWLDPFLGGELSGGLFHACNSGPCTWQEYGQKALDCAHAAGLPLRARTVEAIRLADMKSFIAPRPPYTAMDTSRLTAITGIIPRPWHEAIAEFIGSKQA